MFIGEFDILLMSLFKNRGQVIQLNSPEDALNQKGSFTLIVVNNELSNPDVLSSLSSGYPDSPIVVSANGEREKGYDSARYVKFEEVVDSQISFEEKAGESGYLREADQGSSPRREKASHTRSQPARPGRDRKRLGSSYPP